MREKIVELKLPEFAFVEGSWHEQPNILDGRNVILHIRSASIVEVFDWGSAVFDPEVLTYRFTYTNKHGIGEKKVISLHYSATLDLSKDREIIINYVLIPASKWFCAYLKWEDSQDINPEVSVCGIN